MLGAVDATLAAHVVKCHAGDLMKETGQPIRMNARSGCIGFEFLRLVGLLKQIALDAGDESDDHALLPRPYVVPQIVDKSVHEFACPSPGPLSCQGVDRLHHASQDQVARGASESGATKQVAHRHGAAQFAGCKGFVVFRFKLIKQDIKFLMGRLSLAITHAHGQTRHAPPRIRRLERSRHESDFTYYRQELPIAKINRSGHCWMSFGS